MSFLGMTIQGLGESFGKAYRHQVELGQRADRTIKRVGLFVLRESQRIVPVDTGNLKGSGFMRPTGQGWTTEVTVGYTASYAIYVHENLDAKHKPGKTAKYLERIIHEKSTEIRTIMVEGMRAA